MARSLKDTEDWRGELLRDQERRAERRKRLPFAEKLRILDRLMAEGPPKIEDVPDDEPDDDEPNGG